MRFWLVRLASLLLATSSFAGLFACGHATPAESARARAGRTDTTAWLDPVKVVSAMRGSEGDYRRCFMRAMSERGLVETEFEVGDQGQVTALQIVRSTITRPDVAECLSAELRKHHFESGGSPARGRWTFVFRLTDPIEDDEYARRLAKEEDREDDEGVVVDPDSPGRLDAARIEETVLTAYPLFARCYRDAIERSGRAGGILRFSLVIGESGHLVDVGDGGTVLPDAYAVDCMAEGFYAMKFPEPEGGRVQANYRLDLY